MARIPGLESPGFSLTALIFAAVKRRLGRVVRPVRIHALRSPLLRGYAFMEAGQEGADEVPKALKKLAQIRVAMRVGCPF